MATFHEKSVKKLTSTGAFRAPDASAFKLSKGFCPVSAGYYLVFG